MGFFAAYGDASTALNEIGERKLREQRARADDQALQLKRMREADAYQNAQNVPQLAKGNWEIPTAEEVQPQQTGGGAGYVPRRTPTAAPVTKRTDRPDQLPNEMARLLSHKAPVAATAKVDMERLANLRRQQTQGKILSPEDTKFIQQNRGVGQVPGPTGRPITAPNAQLPTRGDRNTEDFNRLMAMNNTQSAEVVPPQPAATPAPAAGNAPLSVRNNNPGNLKYAGQPGATPDARGFAVFQSPEAGAAAAERQLQIYMTQGAITPQGTRTPPLNTIRAIIGSWSPRSDPGNAPGSTDNYINFVAQKLGISPDQPVTPDMASRILQAMAPFEAGQGGQYTAPAPQTAAPTAQPATPQQPSYANATFGSARPSIPNLYVQQELAYLQRQMASAPDSATAMKYREVYKSAQIGDLVQRAATDVNALRDLAHNSGVMVGRIGNGFVMLAPDPMTGKMVPTGAPVPAGALAQQIQLRIDPVARAAHQKYRMELDMEIFKARSELEKEMEKARISGDYKLTETAMNNANALRTKLMELEQAKVNVDQLNGGAYVTRGSEVTYMKPGTPTKMGQSQPTTTPVQ